MNHVVSRQRIEVTEMLRRLVRHVILWGLVFMWSDMIFRESEEVERLEERSCNIEVYMCNYVRKYVNNDHGHAQWAKP